MNQNLDFDAIKALRKELATQGYVGTDEELCTSIQRMSTASEERKFWILLGLSTPARAKHPFRAWLSQLSRHFKDVTYSTGTGRHLVLLSERVTVEKPRSLRSPRVQSATVNISEMSDGRMEVFVRYYGAKTDDYRRSQTFHFSNSKR